MPDSVVVATARSPIGWAGRTLAPGAGQAARGSGHERARFVVRMTERLP